MHTWRHLVFIAAPHRSQPHHQPRRDVLQHVATARTRPVASPPHGSASCTVYRARQQGCAGQNLQGRVREGVAGANDRPDDTASIGQSIAGLRISRDGHTTRCRRSRRCTTTQQLGPTSSAPMPSGQTSSLLPHRATSQARSSSITAAVWRWSSAPSWHRTHPCPTLIRDARA